MADKTSEDASKIFGLISILEKSIEIQVALMIYCFLIFFDTCSELLTKSGVYELAFGEPNVSITVALATKCVVMIVMFSIVMSLFMPILASLITAGFIVPIAYSKPVLWLWFPKDGGERHTHEMWASGYVLSYAIEEKAHETKDQYYLELAKAAEQRESKEQSDYMRTNMLLLTAFSFSIYNMLGHFDSLSLLQNFSRKIGENGYAYVCMFICVFLVYSIKLVIRDDDVWVYCPSIANEFWEELRKNREERWRFERMKWEGRGIQKSEPSRDTKPGMGLGQKWRDS